MIDLSDIQRVRSQFGKDSEGYFWSSEFVQFYGDLVIASARHKDKILTQVHRKQNYIMHDLRNLGMVLFKLEWIRSRADTDASLKEVWWEFATLDIQQFLVEFRSIFDYIAEIIKEVANKPGQIRNHSFRELRQWLKKNPGNPIKLGKELVNLIESADWFPDVQQLRDSLIHWGAFPLVFLDPKEGILFQSYGDSREPLIKCEMAMYNKNVVDFELYSALYLCKLFLFLEKLAEIIRSKLTIIKINSQAKIYCHGFEFLINWLDRLAEKIKM